MEGGGATRTFFKLIPEVRENTRRMKGGKERMMPPHEKGIIEVVTKVKSPQLSPHEVISVVMKLGAWGWKYSGKYLRSSLGQRPELIKAT